MGGCMSVCRGTSLMPKTSPPSREKVPQRSEQIPNPPTPRAVVTFDDPEAHIIQVEKQLAAISDPGNHPDTARLLDKLTTLYIQRYETRGNLEDLEKVVLNLEKAISIVKDHATQSTFCNNLGRTLLYRYQALGNEDDLKAAISRLEQAVDLMPEDEPIRSMMLSNLATFLSYRYDQTQDLDLLNFVISKGTQAVDTSPEGSHEMSERLQNLATYFFQRYQRQGNAPDLEEAIDKAERALAAIPQGHNTRPFMLMSLASFLLERYKLLAHAEDLDRAISSAEEAIRSTPQDHPGRAGMLTNYGTMLRTRSQVVDSTDDLNDAVLRCQEAADATSNSHALEQGAMLGNLAQSYSARYDRTRNTEDLDAAILHTDRAIQATSREDAVKWVVGLTNISRLLCNRYKRIGNLADLEASISKAEDAVTATSEDHPKLPFRKCNLACSLFERYKTTGDTADLVQAIALVKQAEALRVSLGLPEDTSLLSNLGLFLWEQYQLTGDRNDLETAMLDTKRAIQITAGHSHDREVWRNNLGSMLASRYNITGDDIDLVAAISSTKEALDSIPPDHSDHSAWQSNLAMLLLRRYQVKGERIDIAAAVSNAEASVRSTEHDDHPDHAAWANNLGSTYWYQYKATHNKQCFDAALKCFLETSQSPTSPPLQRISGSRRAMHILHQTKHISRAVKVAQEAIRLLPRMCSPSLRYSDQHLVASQTSGLAADACSVFIEAGMVNEALQAVEFGRGLTLGYLLDSQSDMSELRRMHPSTAESWEKLRSKAFSKVETQGPAPRTKSLVERREDLQRLQELEDHIRSIPGLERFLLPPSVEELMESAAEGPLVVVNITDLGSHAIIVSRSDIKAVPLPEAISRPPPAFMTSLTRYEVERERYVRDFEYETPKYGTDLLSWLWTTCVKPIIEALPGQSGESSSSSQTPRVWWIGTGAASSLPFHAAGIYDHERSTPDIGSFDNCLDRVIPSYTPSIRALQNSREIASRKWKTGRSKLSALVVAMPTTPGLPPLPGALLEQKRVIETVGDALSVKELTGPTAQEVLSALPDANIVRFACHGVPHKDPAKSHLCLQKRSESGLILDKLTVSAILEASPQGKGWIADLSACSTGAKMKTMSVAEENTNLAGAFQVAGFAHVIGSMWPASDDVCVRVAQLFYRSLLENRQARDRNRTAPEALRYALMQVRKDCMDEPEKWALYTHSGA